MICFDTNAAIALLSGQASPVRARFEAALALEETLAISTLVVFELAYGAFKSRRQADNLHKIKEFVASPMQVLPFDLDDAQEAGEVRTLLEQVGRPIGPYDLLIAAQARRRQATLVTANTREFNRVSGLKIEDWTAPL